VNIVNGFGAELGSVGNKQKKYQKLHLQVRHLQVV
jgi:hypothetical protein